MIQIIEGTLIGIPIILSIITDLILIFLIFNTVLIS